MVSAEMKIFEYPEKKGVGFTQETVNAMIDDAVRASVDPNFVRFARNLTKKLNPRNNELLADFFFFWIRQNIKFARDPYHVEYVQSPRRTILEARGDCDCMTTLFMALNLAVGSAVRVVTIATENPQYQNHVYSQVFIPGQSWKPYDLVVTGSKPGWEPPREALVAKIKWEFDGTKKIEDFTQSFPIDDYALTPRTRQLGDTPYMSGFFRKIYDEFKRLERRIRKEIKRVARRIRDEKRRFQERVQAEFERWEDKLGFFGRFLVVGAKVLATVVTGGATIAFMAPGLEFYAAAAVQATDNPFRLNKDEWIFLGQLAGSLGSTIITIVSGGTASGLLAASVLSLASSTASAVKLVDEIEQRQDIIDQLKAQNAKAITDARIKREAMRKMETDIKILRYIQQKQTAYAAQIKAQKAKLDQEIAAFKSVQDQLKQDELAKYRAQKQAEVEAYRKLRLGGAA